jgi:hypothetical protein
MMMARVNTSFHSKCTHHLSLNQLDGWVWLPSVPITCKWFNRNTNNNKKRFRKTSNNNSFLSCHAAIASIAFLFISTLIIFSQLGFFDVHFGLPKLIYDVLILHEADGSHVKMYGSAQIKLNANTMQQLKAYTGGPFTLNIDVTEMPSRPNARIPNIDAATMWRALLGQW